MNIALTQLILATVFSALFALANRAAAKTKISACGRYLIGWVLLVGFLVPIRFQLVRIEIPESAVQEMGFKGEAYGEMLFFPIQPELPYLSGEMEGTPNTSPPETQAPDAQTPMLPTQNEQETAFSAKNAALAIYFAGVLATLFGVFYRYCRTVKVLQRCGRAPTEREKQIFLTLCEKHGISRAPKLLVCPAYAIGSSVMFGVKQQTILIADNFNEEDLALILGHELTHCKRKDPLAKAVFTLLCALYWFNPLIHLFIRTMEDLCEQSCDEKFLNGGGFEEKRRYCRLLVETACLKRTENKLMFTAFKGGKIQMKRRLSNILTKKNKKATALVICTALVLTAISSAVYAVVVPETATPPDVGANAVIGTIDTNERLAPLTDSELQEIEDEVRAGREEINSNYTDEENEYIVEQSTKYSIENKTNGYVTDGKYKGIPSMLTKDGIPVIAIITSDNGGVLCELNPYTNAEGIVLKFTRHADRSMTVEELSMEEYLEYYVSIRCSSLTYEETAKWCEENGIDVEEWTKNTLFLEEYVNEDGTYDFVKFYNDIVEAKGWANEEFINAWYDINNAYEFQDPAAALRTYLSRIGVTVE